LSNSFPTVSSLHLPEQSASLGAGFADRVERFMVAEAHRLFSAVPSARHLASPEHPLDTAYYLRHRVETVKRIWLTSRTDALALASMIDEDYDAARVWSKYITEELSHDILYLRDLEKHGYSLADVAGVPLFPSTTAMVAYISDQIRRRGSLSAVAYSVWVEWHSDKTSYLVVDRARAAFSPKHVKGAHAHTHIDEHEDHYASMLRVVEILLARGAADVEEFFRLLRGYTEFFADYFRELEQAAPIAQR
jgi:hypothetical protein